MEMYLISTAYQVINSAKLTKMEDADKFKVIKAIRAMKPHVKAFEDLVKDAREKLKGDEHEMMAKRAQQWQEEGSATTLTDEERMELNKYTTEYDKKVDECVREEAEKDIDLSFDKLSEDAFGKFIASNDFDVKTIMLLQDALMG